MILHGIEYQRPTSLNMRIMADHVTYSFLAFMKSIFHFCLGCYCGGYSQNGRSNLSSCCKKTFYCNDNKITEFEITDKNSSTAYIILYKWIDTWFLDSNRRVGVWSLPWRWHILSIPLTTGRGTSVETCGLDDVFPPDDFGSRPEALC